MKDPKQHEDSEERAVTPAEIWEQLSPDVQARVCNLLARMAYKYALAQSGSLPDGTEVRGEIQSNES